MASTGDTSDVNSLREYAAIVRRRKWLVVAPILIALLAAGAATLATEPTYEASADVLVRLPPTASSVGSTGSVMSPRLVENELQEASGSTLQSFVRDEIGSEPALSVDASDGSDVFTFTATSSDPQRAADAANAYAAEYVERQRARLVDEFETRAAILTEQLGEIDDETSTRARQLEREIDDLELSIELARSSGSNVIDVAVVPTSPVSPSMPRNLLLAGTIGLIVGLGLAFFVDFLDTRIRDEDDLVSGTGLPNLAIVPKVDASSETGLHLYTLEDPQSPAAEAYRNLRTAVRFSALDRSIRTLLVTSARPSEGKTTTAANLAVAAAQSGQRVVLVDCDLRKPQIHTMFGVANGIGFTSVLLGEIEPLDATRRRRDLDDLVVVTSGPRPPNPSELLSGERARRALEELSASADLVVIDSPPVLAVTDPVALATLADGVILVASTGRTDRRSLASALQRLTQVDARLVGTVLNQHVVRRPDAEQYRYAYGDDGNEPPDVVDAPREVAAR